jgi:hypothetical protein
MKLSSSKYIDKTMGGEMHYLTADNRDFLLELYQNLSGENTG